MNAVKVTVEDEADGFVLHDKASEFEVRPEKSMCSLLKFIHLLLLLLFNLFFNFLYYPILLYEHAAEKL